MRFGRLMCFLQSLRPHFLCRYCDRKSARSPPKPIASVVMGNLKKQHKPNRQTTLKQIVKHILTIFSLTVLVTSCNKTTPAGFWTDFHKDLLLTKNSDQGPWGGHREIYWKSETNNSFTDKELIEFADKNDWQLVDSISFSADSITKNSFSKLKNDDYSLDILKETVLPKLKTKNNRIFIFKTTWLAVEPGNARETYENGFAVLNSDGTELKVYHLWGE